MKANLVSLVLFFFLLAGSPANAQPARIMVNSNYYDGYDYHFSSRINRFHRSYAAFSYYAPVFTDVYWYDYQPFTWGLSIYGGGFGSYPVYGYYHDGWYDPYYGLSWYNGYDPFYYSWYSPVLISFNFFRPRWHTHYNNYYYSYSNYNYITSGYNRYYSSPAPRYYNTRSGSSGVYRRESGSGTTTSRYTDRTVTERTRGNSGNNGTGNNGNTGNSGNDRNRDSNNNGNNGNRYWDDNNRNPNNGNRYGNDNVNEGKPGNRNPGRVDNAGSSKGNAAPGTAAPNQSGRRYPVIRSTAPSRSGSGVRSSQGPNRQVSVQRGSSSGSRSSVSRTRSSSSNRSSSGSSPSSSRSSSSRSSRR